MFFKKNTCLNIKTTSHSKKQRRIQKKYIAAHLKFLMEGTDKIYDAYPYEYYLYHGHHNKAKLKEELSDMKRGVMRDYHEEHVRFHELILGKNDI